MNKEIKHLMHKLTDDNKRILFSVDQYGNYLVINFSESEFLANVKFEAEKIVDFSKFEAVFFLRDYDVIEKIGESEEFIDVEEGNIKYQVKIPFFRKSIKVEYSILRKLIGSYSKNKNILNLFAGGGSFTISALVGGANSVVSVEPDTRINFLIENNIKLNNTIITEEQIKASVLFSEDIYKYIDLCLETKTKYDLIILDAPSKNKNFDFNNQHKELIRVLNNKILNTGGMLFVISDDEEFVMDSYLRPGADKLTKQTIPTKYLPGRPHQAFVFYN